jgi:hypothetical protein
VPLGLFRLETQGFSEVRLSVGPLPLFLGGHSQICVPVCIAGVYLRGPFEVRLGVGPLPLSRRIYPFLNVPPRLGSCLRLGTAGGAQPVTAVSANDTENQVLVVRRQGRRVKVNFLVPVLQVKIRWRGREHLR